MTKYNILATYTHTIKPDAMVHNLWQMITQQAGALAQWLLSTDLPKGVPSIPYEAPSCLPSRPALEVDPGQSALSCYFEGCNQRIGICAMQWHVAQHLLLGHKWPKQQTTERDDFGLLCASCASRCTTLMGGRKVHTTCSCGYTNFGVLQRAQQTTLAQMCLCHALL